MSTVTEPRTQTRTQERTREATETPNIDSAIKETFARVTKALEAREESIEELLPDFMKGQGKRLIARARQFWARGNFQLQRCTEASFIGCVLAAAELGFAIDGRMAHAVPYNTKVKGPDGRERWEDKAQLVVDYKGLIAVAKRHKLVQDVWARVIYKTDGFLYQESDGRQHYNLDPDLTISRDDLKNARGVLAVATHEDGWIRTDFMPIADIERIRNRSKGYKADNPNVPWNTQPGEMAKKTAIKRLLKTFSDDPGLLRTMELDDESEREAETEEPESLPRTNRTEALAEKIVKRFTKQDVKPAPDPEPVPEPPADSQEGIDEIPPDDEAQPEPPAAEQPAEASQPPRHTDADTFDEYCDLLRQTKTLDDVKGLLTQYLTGFVSSEYRGRAQAKAEMRQVEIKGARGEKSNKQKSLV